jgi:hypothetical protein
MPEQKEQKTICCDFDGVICASQYPGLGPLIPGAKQALQLLKALGYRIIISSCRSCAWNWDIYYKDTEFKHAKDRQVFKDMVTFLDENEIPYDEIDDGTKGKVSAAYYIDDKGIRFQNNWEEIAFLIHQEDIRVKVQEQQAAQAVAQQQAAGQSQQLTQEQITQLQAQRAARQR